MGRERTVKIDPFIQFLMDERNFAYTYEAAKEIGMDPRRLNTYATRGVRSLPAMRKLAEDFGVSIEKMGLWISANIHMLTLDDSETEVIEIAS